jgi:hypothetical protein
MGAARAISPSHPSGGEGWGEGVVRIPAERYQDGSEDSVDIGQNILVCETDYPVAACLQRESSCGVVSLPVAVRVSVDLDNQPMGPGGEIGDVGCNNHLFLEFHAEAVGAQSVPEALFGLRLIDSMTLGAISRLDVPLQTTPSPCPRPLKGERVPVPSLSRTGERVVAEHCPLYA